MSVHVSSTMCSSSRGQSLLYHIWYRHAETSEWSKITKIRFYKYEHILVKFMYEFFECDYCILLTIKFLHKFIHKVYYYVLLFIELYFSNFTTQLFQCDDTRCSIIQF